MRRKRLTQLLLAISLAACNFTGCQNKWQKAAVLTDDFAHSVKTAQDIEIQAFNQGLISHDDHIAVETVFLELGKDGQILDAAIRQGSSSTTISSAFSAALDVTKQALDTADLHIKNPDTKAKIDIVLVGAKGILDTMKALQ